jgi:hypothetical protein
MKAPYPLKSMTGLIANGDRVAIGFVKAMLNAAHGDVTATARLAGVSKRTLYNWRDSNAELRRAFDQVAIGRAGAGRNATKARVSRRG